MDRFVVLVDAGYVWVQFVSLVYGSSNHGRESITIDISKMNESLTRKLEEIFPGKELLRIYWYDGLVQSSPSLFNQKLSMVDGYKLRYGTVNKVGQQKGVDGLIIADLLSLSQYRAISDGLLVSGDGDLAPGVAAAQAMGIKILRLEIGSSVATSPTLRSEVDKNIIWDEQEVLQFVTRSRKDNLVGQIDDKSLWPIIQGYVDSLEKCELIVNQNNLIDPKIDKGLLDIVKDKVGHWLTEEEREVARDIFKKIYTSSKQPKQEQTSQVVHELIIEEDIAKRFAEILDDKEKSLLEQSKTSIPREIDKKLLCYVKQILGRDLNPEERKIIRASLSKLIKSNC